MRSASPSRCPKRARGRSCGGCCAILPPAGRRPRTRRRWRICRCWRGCGKMRSEPLSPQPPNRLGSLRKEFDTSCRRDCSIDSSQIASANSEPPHRVRFYDSLEMAIQWQTVVGLSISGGTRSEMTLKAAYFSLMGRSETHPITWNADLKPAMKQAVQLGIAWNPPNAHNVRAWAERARGSAKPGASC